MGSSNNTSNLKPGWLRPHVEGQTIVFIHGFTGSASSTWGLQDYTWPEILTSDSRFDGVGVFLAEYESKLNSGQYGFEEASRQVMTQLEVASSTGPKLTDCHTIMFVGHSAGGIISRNVLVNNLWAFRGKKIGLALVGSPSKGSPWADALHALRNVPIIGKIGGKQLGQLTTTSLFLHALDAKFQFLIDNEFLTIVGRELVEHKGKFRGTPAIVSKESAAVYYKAESVVIASSDHSSICRPDSADAQAHQELVRLWHELLAAQQKVDEGVRQEEAKLRCEADHKLYLELQSVLGDAPKQWQEWSPGISYNDEWFTHMLRFESRATEPDCFFHDPDLQGAHLHHYESAKSFRYALSLESEYVREGTSRISKHGQGEYIPGARKDKYDEALERVDGPYEKWVIAYRNYIKTFKEILIL